MEEKVSGVLQVITNDLIHATIIGSKALLILVVGVWFAYFISGRVKKILLKTLKDEMLSGFLAKVAFVAVVIIVVVATLGTIGVQTASIIAALGAAGLAIALALKDSLGNLASGIMLIVFRPFTKGDTIEIIGALGAVEDISLFHTYMRTPDGKLVIIPNNSVVTNPVTNFTAKATNSRKNQQEIIETKEVIRRIDWLVGVDYKSDIDRTRQVILSAVENTPNIDKGATESGKKVFVAVNELQASAIEFVVRAWVVDNDLFFQTKCNMIENVKKALDAEKIEIPFNKMDVTIVK